jgi:hypothetical protein
MGLLFGLCTIRRWHSGSTCGQVPIRWPASRDEVWQANVPHTFLATEKSDQHWMVVNNQKVNFPGGGTHFPDGADKYIVHLGKVNLCTQTI